MKICIPGNIENSLIHYNRPDQSGPKRSDVTMLRIDSEHGSTLKQVLTASNGVKVVVDKTREICFVENVKFHIDEVKQLGAFVEIEAIDENGSIGEEKLLQQCKHWLKKLEIDDKSLIEQSYSDLILEKEKKEEDWMNKIKILIKPKKNAQL